jgi:HTH-type transcriptional regulator/antitoxin HigA
MLLADKNLIEHPGGILKEELFERGWTKCDLCWLLDYPLKSLNLIINGKKGISPNMSKALGKAFSVSEEFFSNLQNAYDLSKVNED